MLYFNPRTPCGVRRYVTFFVTPNFFIFQSTHPLRGATTNDILLPRTYKFQSTHPLRGATHHQPERLVIRIDFNPRTPCGVRLEHPSKSVLPTRISIHAPLAGCDRNVRAHKVQDLVISIHAPLAGCDLLLQADLCGYGYFNPRTPCGVRRLLNRNVSSLMRKFQSTHPLRGATRCICFRLLVSRYFNPRTPCGVRPMSSTISSTEVRFQSTHPLRGATVWGMLFVDRMENFNPRTPCGVRRRAGLYARAYRYFNPRTPCGVRQHGHRVGRPRRISIHAPLAGCDPWHCLASAAAAPFQSTHPLRGATQPSTIVAKLSGISIHAPLAGCDDIGWGPWGTH